MSNTYSQMTASDSVKCSREDFDALKAALGINESDDGDGDHVVHEGTNIQFELHDGKLYVFADESFSFDELPKPAILKLAAIIGMAGLPYLQFGVGCWGDKAKPGEAWGTEFRLYADGSIVDPVVQWPES